MDYKMNGLDGRIYKLMKREEEKRKLMKNIIGYVTHGNGDGDVLVQNILCIIDKLFADKTSRGGIMTSFHFLAKLCTPACDELSNPPIGNRLNNTPHLCMAALRN